MVWTKVADNLLIRLPNVRIYYRRFCGMCRTCSELSNYNGFNWQGLYTMLAHVYYENTRQRIKKRNMVFDM
jgi:hypothetical protein